MYLRFNALKRMIIFQIKFLVRILDELLQNMPFVNKWLVKNIIFDKLLE